MKKKIYSGDVVFLAEVLRDLHRNVDDPNRSYSERVIYESAFQRFINLRQYIGWDGHVTALICDLCNSISDFFQAISNFINFIACILLAKVHIVSMS